MHQNKQFQNSFPEGSNPAQMQGPMMGIPMMGGCNHMSGPNGGRNYPTLYVGDLDQAVTEEMLYNFFIKYGPIYSVRIMRDYQNKKSRGFAFLSFYSLRDAETAKNNSNHEYVLSNPIRVTWKKNIKELNALSNVFIRDFDISITLADIDSAFSEYGTIFSSKIALDEQGKSRGYGYVQFESKESAEKCLQSADIKVKDSNIKSFSFKRKNDRVNPRTNLYVKNMPNNQTVDEIKIVLLELCKTLGDVISIDVKLQKESLKPFAFICFKEKLEAEEAFKVLGETDCFNTGEKLYVNWAQKKFDRQILLRELYSKQTNETNLFTKNLSQDVTKEQLLEIFSKFGEVLSCDVKSPPEYNDKPNSKNLKVDTKFGFINFKDKENARKALVSSRNDEELKKLYHGGLAYVNYHIKKEQYASYKFSRVRQYKNYKMSPQFFDPYMMMMMMQNAGPMGMPFGMGMGQMGPNMGGYNGFKNNFSKGGNYKRTNYQNRAPYQNKAQSQQQAQKQTPSIQNASAKKMTIQGLKENLGEFTKMEKERQSTILGELLYPMVRELAKVKDLSPKITGMLIDFDVFEVSDILEFLESTEHLKERVEEAEELIQQQPQ